MMQRTELAEPPGVRSLDLLHTVAELRRDPLAFLLDVRRRHGDVAKISLAHRTFILVSHPDGVRHVLVDNARGYGKRTASFAKVRSIVGEGLLTSDGEDWLQRRRVVQPAFTQDRAIALGPSVIGATSAMLARWRLAAGQPFDLAREMTRLTLEIVTTALLGGDLDDDADRVGRAVCTLVEHTNRRIESIVDFGSVFPTLENLRAARARRAMGTVIEKLLAVPPSQGTDLLCRLREACRSSDGRIDAERLRDEVTTMFLAGHEHVGGGLVWTLHEITRRAHIAERIQEEQRTVLGGRDLTVEDLPRLRFVEAVLKESMRLHPPVWLLERNALEDDEVGGYRIPRGATVAVSPYVTHRHPDVWTDPETFEPDRFASGRLGCVPRFAFLPFGAGARRCVGGHFAMMEAKVIVTMVLRAFALRALGAGGLRHSPGITLRPRDRALVSAHPLTREHGP